MVHLTYVVGDVHGSYHLLRRALVAIARHARGQDHGIIALGDYIDRGEDACQTLEFLVGYRGVTFLTCLKGNHEQMLLDCIDSGSGRQLRSWLGHGGAQTLASYAIAPDDPRALEKLPQTHVRWMRHRPVKVESAHHIFVHAGIVPDLSLVHQDEADFIWIRERFLEAKPRQFLETRHIAHGHTCSWKGKPDAAIPELLSHRSNLDTAAYRTGVLSVGVFVSDERGGVVDLLSIV